MKTTEQENKELKKLLKDKKHYMANKDKEKYEREIYLLKNSVKDYNKIYDLMMKYKKEYTREKEHRKELQKEEAKLNKKISYIHAFYQKIIREMDGDTQ